MYNYLIILSKGGVLNKEVNCGMKTMKRQMWKEFN